MPLIEAFSLYPELPVILAIIFGLMVGSFLNVVVHRLPIMMEREWLQECRIGLQLPDPEPATTPFNLAVPRSRCPHCGHNISAWENIPVISYLLLRGKCADCKSSISVRYPLVELACGLLTGLTLWHFGPTPMALALVLLVWGLLTLTLIDIDHQLLPDSITLPLLWFGLAVNALGVFTTLESALWGAIAGYLSLWTVYWAFKLATGKEGMGYGDFKLLAALGAWMGWQALPLIIILSSLVGAIWGIAMHLAAGRDNSQPMPFGPFLAVAGLITLFYGEQITQQYFQLLGY